MTEYRGQITGATEGDDGTVSLTMNVSEIRGLRVPLVMQLAQAVARPSGPREGHPHARRHGARAVQARVRRRAARRDREGDGAGSLLAAAGSMTLDALQLEGDL